MFLLRNAKTSLIKLFIVMLSYLEASIHQSNSKNQGLNMIVLSIFSPWSCLWNRQVRDRYCGYVRHATRVDHEIHHSSGHGWYSGHLRSGRCCSYSQRNRCQL